MQTPHATHISRDNYDDTPRKFRAITNIYNNIEPIKMDEELFRMGVNEPTCYRQATKMNEWKQAMSKEIESIEKNNT